MPLAILLTHSGSHFSDLQNVGADTCFLFDVTMRFIDADCRKVFGTEVVNSSSKKSEGKERL